MDLRTDGGRARGGDGERERVSLSEWSRVVDHLERLGETGDVAVDADEVSVRVGSSSVVVTRDGRVETGMPLHEFAADGVAALAFNHDAGVLAVETDDVTYEFRRP
ncbi:MAG: hypothetical protein ABEJ79_11500 [Halolamina sp.]